MICSILQLHTLAVAWGAQLPEGPAPAPGTSLLPPGRPLQGGDGGDGGGMAGDGPPGPPSPMIQGYPGWWNMISSHQWSPLKGIWLFFGTKNRQRLVGTNGLRAARRSGGLEARGTHPALGVAAKGLQSTWKSLSFCSSDSVAHLATCAAQ